MLVARINASTHLYDPSKVLANLHGTKHEASIEYSGQSITN